eukprot:2672101-Pyramimonas_sp.AAC.1
MKDQVSGLFSSHAVHRSWCGYDSQTVSRQWLRGFPKALQHLIIFIGEIVYGVKYDTAIRSGTRFNTTCEEFFEKDEVKVDLDKLLSECHSHLGTIPESSRPSVPEVPMDEAAEHAVASGFVVDKQDAATLASTLGDQIAGIKEAPEQKFKVLAKLSSL